MAMEDPQLAQLYDRLKHTVWVIKVGIIRKHVLVETYATGFYVGNGLIMTQARALAGINTKPRKVKSGDSGRNSSKPSKSKGYGGSGGISITGDGGSREPSIMARRLTESAFIHSVKVKKVEKKLNLALLEIEENNDDFLCGYLAAEGSGSLLEGDTLLFIGHLNDFVGSFLIGRNAFRCPETLNECVDILNDEIQKTLTCGKHALDAPDAITRDYRIMGNIYNSERFQRLKSMESGESEGAGSKFERELNPLTPIIQCNGFAFHPNDVSEGGPVFNRRGDVVGMLVSTVDSYQFAIHVSMLKAWLNTVQEGENV